jgi:hypothetical protein
MAYKITPPKFAIANGFVIESFPREIKFFNKEGQKVTREVEDDKLTDTLKAMVAPLRPNGCVFAYSGGAQKSLRGNYQFFEIQSFDTTEVSIYTKECITKRKAISTR